MRRRRWNGTPVLRRAQGERIKAGSSSKKPEEFPASGLERETGFEPATIQEFEQALPGRSRDSIHRLLRELKAEGKVEVTGKKRGSRWVPKG
jgi:hypothetical protein